MNDMTAGIAPQPFDQGLPFEPEEMTLDAIIEAMAQLPPEELEQELALLSDEQRERVEELLRDRAEARLERLSAFAESLKRTRKRAVEGRQRLGIEEEWRRAEEAYEGVDDANRDVKRAGRAVKPEGTHRSMVQTTSGQTSTRSSILLNITRNYVDAASARVGDMMLPVDDSCWAIEPTAVPDLGTKGPEPGAPSQPPAPPPAPPQPEAMPPGMGPEAMPPGAVPPGAMPPGAMPPGAMPPGATPPGMGAPPAEPRFPESELVIAARKAAEGAQRQITDWLEETHWHAHMRKMFDDAALLGTGVIKGPFPAHRISRKVTTGLDGQAVVEQVAEIVPESKCIPPWNCYPDPDCGADVKDGSFFWEYDRISAKQLRDMAGLPGYLEDQIRSVLEKGPGYSQDPAAGPRGCTDDDMFEVWYFTGRAEMEDLEAAGVEVGGHDALVGVPCIVTMVEDTVVQAALNPLESGELPYDFLPWQRRAGMPWGIGVGTQMETSQRGLTATLRALMDNAGVASGAQVVINRNSVEPADGEWRINPGVKVWWLKPGADVAEVGKAFDVFLVPSLQPQLQAILEFFMRTAESETGITSMLQGQAQVAGPDTYGGQLLLMNNAGALLRRIARSCDDLVVERHILRYYEWLLLYGEDDSIKGDFQIRARGSTAMVELALQNQFIFQMGQMVDNPAFGVDPEKWFAEMLKSQRLDPERFLMDDDKKAALAQQEPPPAPQVMAAQIRAEAGAQIMQMQTQATMQVAQMQAEARVQISQMQEENKARIAQLQEENKAQIAQLMAQMQQAIAQAREEALVEKMRIDTDRDAVAVQAQADRTRVAALGKQQELELRRQLAMLEYANREKISLDKIKADLAKESMRIGSVERLAAIGARADQMPRPPVEPPGEAPAGESWQK